jgi:hypothetical protein
VLCNITTILAPGTNERLAEEARSILSTFGKKADLLDAAAPVIATMLDRLVDHEAAPFLFTPLLEYYRGQRDAFFEERAKQPASEETGWDAPRPVRAGRETAGASAQVHFCEPPSLCPFKWCCQWHRESQWYR